MGVPADIDELAATGVVSAEGVGRARREPRLEPGSGDVSVTEYVGGRLGAEVVDRLVDPLLGGVYAGRSEELSFEATLAPLAAAARRHATLTEAAASLLPPPPADASEAKTGVRDAHHGARRPARGRRQGVQRRGPRERDGPRARAHGNRLAAHHRLRRRPGVPGGGRGHPRRPGRAGGPPPQGHGPRGGSATWHRSRTRAWRSSRSPTANRISRGSSAAATSCPPSTGRPSRPSRSPRSSGRTSPRASPSTSSAAPSAGSGRQRCSSATTRTWPPSPPPSSRQRPG